MGTIKILPPVKLIAGILFSSDGVKKSAYDLLETEFGPIEGSSGPGAFLSTGYYRKERGGALKREFIKYKRLIRCDNLPDIKIKTTEVELSLRDPGSQDRKINIDPGYFTLDKLVLASTKNFSHRIYLGKGIFADLTLRFIGESFSPHDWTFPEYREKEKINLFNSWRTTFKEDLQLKKCSDMK